MIFKLKTVHGEKIRIQNVFRNNIVNRIHMFRNNIYKHIKESKCKQILIVHKYIKFIILYCNKKISKTNKLSVG